MEKNIETITLKKIQFGLRERVSKEFLDSVKIETEYDVFTETLVQGIRWWVFGQKVSESVIETISYPDGWWQAFKQAYFPEFLKQRFPVREITVDVIKQHFHVCPHLNIAPQGDHLKFLAYDDVGRL